MIIKLILLPILLFLSGFFSSAETALTMANPVKIRTLYENGNIRASVLLKIFQNQNKMLTCILIGNNLVNISASSLSATLALEIWGNVGVGLATGILTLLVLIFGEITPKTWAAYDPESLALSYAPVIYALMILLTPLIYIVDLLALAIMKAFHIDTSGQSRLMTAGELRTYVDVGHEDGAIEADEKRMIYKVFDFSDSAVKDIMIPRIDLTVISKDGDYDSMMQLFEESKYTRLPVYENDPENIIGIVNMKDLVFAKNKDSLKASDIMREAYFTYEHKKTDDLLEEMRLESYNMAFILDEYGSCVGMVTMEDLLEEIVGDIRDEYDDDEKELIKPLGNKKNRYLIEGTVKIVDINDVLDINIKSAEYDSIGGLLSGSLGRIPRRGEGIEYTPGIIIRAAKVSKKRVEKVILSLKQNLQ